MSPLKGSIIELDSFEDLVYFVFSRITTVGPNASVLCSKSKCFTVVSGGDEQVFIIASPSPEKRCRFAYVDESGRVQCSNAPLPGKPMIIVVSVKRVEKVEDVPSFLKELVVG